MLALATVVLAVGAVPAWRRLSFYWQMSAARGALDAGEGERAIELLQQLAESSPQDPEVAYLLCSAYRRAGKIVAARESLRRACDLGWSRRDAQLQELLIEFRAGQVEATEQALLEKLEDGCSIEMAAEIYECLVQGFLADLRIDEAGLTLDHWIDWQPTAVRPRLLRAQLFRMAQVQDREEKEYRDLLALDPDNLDARTRMGYIFLEAKDVGGAAEMFRGCIESRPDDPSLWIPLAACERRNGRSDEAQSLLRRALAEKLDEPRRAYALVELAQIVMEEKDYDEALALLDKAIKLSPSDRSAHYARGLALSRLGRKQEAEKALEKSRLIFDLSERLQDLAKRAARQPEDANLRCDVGEIELELDERPEALAWLLSALRCDKWHERTHLALAKYYTLVGQQDMVDQHMAWAGQSRRQARKEFLSPLPASAAVSNTEGASP